MKTIIVEIDADKRCKIYLEDDPSICAQGSDRIATLGLFLNEHYNDLGLQLIEKTKPAIKKPRIRRRKRSPRWWNGEV